MTRYLLDTHALLWYLEDSPNLPASVAEMIEDADAQVFISIATFWEAAIKHNLGKLEVEGDVSMLWHIAAANGYQVLPIGEPHLSGLAQLPWLHRDPFDRLLVSTAKAEGMTILSADENVRAYDVRWAW